MIKPSISQRVDRRQLLRGVAALAGMAAAGAVLQACGGSTAPVTPTSSSSAAVPAGATTSAVAAGASSTSAGGSTAGSSSAASTASFDQLLKAAKQEGHANLWSNVPTVQATLQKLQQAFDKKFGGGIAIDQVPLTAGEAASRLIAEAQAGRHDGDMLQPSPDIVANLMQANLTVKRDWQQTFASQLPSIQEVVAGVPIPDLRDVALSYWDVVYVLLYNTSEIQKAQLPKTWEDLGTAQFGSKLAIDVRGYPFNFLVLDPSWGQAKTEKLVRDINAQKPLKQPGAGQVGDAVARGDAPMGIGSVADVFLQKKKGRPVEGLVFQYVPLNPLMAFVPKQPGHPNAAQLFAAWMTTEGVSILEAEEFNGRLSRQGSPTHQLVYSQQPTPKLAVARSLQDMKTSATFLKLAGEILTGAK